MENKITKNLIILGAIIFSFALTNNVFAYTNYAFSNDGAGYQYDSASAFAGNQGYSQYYYQTSGYNPTMPQTINPVNSANPYNTNQAYQQPVYNPVQQPVYNPVTSYNPVYAFPQYGYYQTSGYSTSTQPSTSVVNNYYQTVPVASTSPAAFSTTARTNTISTTTDTTNRNTTANNTTITTGTTGSNIVGYNSGYNNSNGGYNNSNNGLLGASAYNGYGQVNGNGLTALSLAGSGGFMPSSIWQWIFVIILILVIVIISRMFIKKPT